MVALRSSAKEKTRRLGTSRIRPSSGNSTASSAFAPLPEDFPIVIVLLPRLDSIPVVVKLLPPPVFDDDGPARKIFFRSKASFFFFKKNCDFGNGDSLKP